jgi:high-affinity nickel-transport protein
MAAVVIGLHVVGWVTLLVIVVPGHYRVGTQVFGAGMRKVYYNITITGLSVLVALLIGTVEIFGLIAQEMGLGGAFWTWVAGLNINTLGYAIVGLFVLTWVVALVAWRAFQIEQRFSRPALRRPRELPEAAE